MSLMFFFIIGQLVLLKKPELKIVVDEVTEKVNFTCSYEPLQDTTLSYIISFLYNDVEINNSSTTSSAYLSEDELPDITYSSKVRNMFMLCYYFNTKMIQIFIEDN